MTDMKPSNTGHEAYAKRPRSRFLYETKDQKRAPEAMESELICREGRPLVASPSDLVKVSPVAEHWLEYPAGARLPMLPKWGRLVDYLFHEFPTFATDGRRQTQAETKRWF